MENPDIPVSVTISTVVGTAGDNFVCIDSVSEYISGRSVAGSIRAVVSAEQVVSCSLLCNLFVSHFRVG